MHRPKSGKIIKYTALIALVFLSYVMQGMIFTHLKILGIKPLLLPIVAVGIGMYEGSERGAIMGLIAGIFCDLSFNQPTIGFTLILTAVGLFSGILCERILEKSLPSCLLCSVVALALSASVQIFSLFIYQDVPIMSLLETALIQTIYSIVFIIPIYYLCRIIGKISYRS